MGAGRTDRLSLIRSFRLVTTSYLLVVRQVDFGVVTLQVMSERYT